MGYSLAQALETWCSPTGPFCLICESVLQRFRSIRKIILSFKPKQDFLKFSFLFEQIENFNFVMSGARFQAETIPLLFIDIPCFVNYGFSLAEVSNTKNCFCSHFLIGLKCEHAFCGLSGTYIFPFFPASLSLSLWLFDDLVLKRFCLYNFIRKIWINIYILLSEKQYKNEK